jgi:hypothetical protein
MAVVRIGQGKRGNQVFVTSHEAVTNGLVHQVAGSCQALGGEAWIVIEDTASLFTMDRFGPPSNHKPCLRDPD